MIDVMDLALYIVNKCMNEGCPVTNLQLQKILYYIQVEFLKKKGVLIFEDSIEAWKFGPVIPRVYFAYSHFGAMPIYCDSNSAIDNISIHDKALIDSVTNSKKDLPPWALVTDTHMPGKAWSRAYTQNGSGSVISTDDMRKYG